MISKIFPIFFSSLEWSNFPQINSMRVCGLALLCVANGSDDKSLLPSGTGQTVLTHTTPLYCSTLEGHSNPTVYHYTQYRLNTRPGERMTEWCMYVCSCVCVRVCEVIAFVYLSMCFFVLHQCVYMCLCGACWPVSPRASANTLCLW